MPPIQVFSNSPINASKPSGSTPKTSHEEPKQENTAPAPATASSQYQPSYPAAQPGAVPSLPQPTNSYTTAAYQPTPTRAFSGDVSSGSPPPPQPGAVPVLPGGGGPTATHLPPPPKAGEKLSSQHQQPMTTSMPPQMSYSLSGASVPPHQLGSSTSTAPRAQTQGYPGPTSLMEGGSGNTYAHPPGYQQNAGQNQQRPYPDDNGRGYEDQDESVWGTAKKWAYAAGDSLAKAENEVWKRINKD